MSDFVQFRDQVRKQLKSMGDELFVVDVGKDNLWDLYLNSFPAGSDPLYNERTEHNCSCCKQFIRAVGNVVSIKNGNLVSVWDVKVDEPYQSVADVLSKEVKSRKIKNIFLTDQQKVGVLQNHGQNPDGDVVSFDHFFVNLPNSVVERNSTSINTKLGHRKSDVDVLKRSLEEISLEAIEIVEELIDQNSLYRGQEHLRTVKALKETKKRYDKLKNLRSKEIFLWKTAGEKGSSVRFKNTVIGTLLEDISDGKDLEASVKSFEQKVAPQNYKRTTALITGTMIKKAEEKVEKLGIEDSLKRRYAVTDDLTINNVLFADRSAKEKMKGSVFDDIKPTAKDKKPNLDKVQEINVDEFVDKVLPKIDSMEVLVENKHVSNLVSLVAPVNEDAPNIFKWGNKFSWSYNGEVTDSIKERVKAAGGNVTGDVRVSLSWFNYDDLDIHVIEPGGNEIYFGRKKSGYTGGNLDVDMNACGRNSREPVENVVWPNKGRMKKGDYRVFVNNYSKRETIDVGFVVEVEYDGKVDTFVYEKAVRNNENVDVLTLTCSEKNVLSHKGHIKSSSASQEVWGINTEGFHKVNMVMNSPNHWDGEKTGNKHLFFILDGCKNPDKARGFYNEFLTGELEEHRKVFEVLGSKMKTEESDNQLSGLGFSSTKENSLVCKVRGSFNRTLKIKF